MIRCPAFRTAIAALVMAVWFAQSLQAKRTAAELQDQYAKLSRHFAEANHGWQPTAPATGALVFVAPDEYSGLYPPGNSNQGARSKYADALFDLARQAAEAGQLSLAFQWATET